MAKNTKGLTITKTLLDTAIEEEQHEWLDDEIYEVCTIIIDIKTIQLQSRIPLKRLDKAFYLYVPPRTSIQSLQLPITTLIPTLATTLIATLASTLAISTKITINALETIGTSAIGATATAIGPTTIGVTSIRDVQPLSYTKEIATIAKIYTDDQKYNGTSDSFDFKLTIFHDICERAGLPREGYIKAFPTMLKGLAQAHYYNCSLSTKQFDAACTHMRNFFEGPE